MALFVKQQKSFAAPPERVTEAAQAAIGALGGKPLAGKTGALEAKFDKTVLGKVLGDRTQVKLTITPAEGGSAVDIECFPLNAIGQRLMFGERAGVSETVVGLLFSNIEARLK